MKKLYSVVLILLSVSLFAQHFPTITAPTPPKSPAPVGNLNSGIPAGNPAPIKEGRGTIKGYVFDKATTEGIPYVTVKVEGTPYGAATDDNGFFLIPNLKPGAYKLSVSYIGFIKQTLDVEVKENESNNLKFYLLTQATDLNGVDIMAEKIDKTTETRVSVTSITPIELRRLPGVGGEADIAQYMTVIPGVVSTGDQGGQVVIRGGTPVQTEFLLDGIPVFNPFHSIGLFSVYETNVVKNIDVYAGGFPAEYGGRTSAVVDVTTRDGNRSYFSGKVEVNPFVSHAVLEIPVIKLKQDNNTNASLILSSKVSYLDETSKVLYKYAGTNGLPYSFYDGYGKFSLNMGLGTKLTLTGFDYNDKATFQAANYQWNEFGVGGNFLAVPRNSNLYFNTHVSYSRYNIALGQADNLNQSSYISGFDIGMDFNYYIKNGELKYGINIEGLGTNFNFTNSFMQQIAQNQNTTDLSAYFSYHKYIKKIVVEAGGRFEYYGKVQGISPEPRLSLKYNVNDWFRVKLATGLYSQDFLGTTSNQDVVALFTGFLTGPDETPVDGNGKQYNNIRNFQRSTDGILGFELDLPKNVTINIEPYYKYFWHVFSINFNAQAQDQDYLIEKGDAYGVDFLAKWQWNNLYLYATYSLAWVYYNDIQQIYPPSFDRRNNVNLLGSYDFGKKKDWEVSLRWNLGSGFPFIRTQALYEEQPFSQGISSNYLTNNGNLGELLSAKINDGRLPYYHRLDFSIRKTFNLKKRMKFDINASVTNMYDRQNIFYFDRITFTRINQLPIIPSIGLAFSW